LNNHDLKKKKLEISIIPKNLLSSTLKIKKEDTIKENHLALRSINPLNDSSESNYKMKNNKKLFYHRKNINNNFSSIKYFSSIHQKALYNKENNNKSESNVSNSNSSISRIKIIERNSNQDNKYHLITKNKNISLYDSYNNLIDNKLKFYLETLKNRIKNESKLNILESLNSFEKTIKKDQSKI